jgi:O-antigen ligase
MAKIVAARGRWAAREASEAESRTAALVSERPRGLAPCLFYLFIEFARPMAWVPPLALVRPGVIAAIWGIVAVLRSKHRPVPRPVWLMMGFAAVMGWNVPWAMNNFLALWTFVDFSILVAGSVLPLAVLPANLAAARYLLSAYVFLHVPMAIHGLLNGGRGLTGWMGDENDLALALNIAIGIGIYLFIETRSVLKRVLLLTAMGTMLAAIVASISRGGFVGLAALGVFVLITGPRRGTVALCVVLAAVSLWLFAPATYWDEVGSIQTAAEPGDTGEQRFYLWGMAWRMFLDHPVTGVGSKNYGIHAPDYEDVERAETTGFHTWGRVAHSMYFTLLAEQGAAGTILFLSILGWCVVAQWRIRRWARGHPEDPSSRTALLLGSGLFAGIFALLATGAFLTVTYYPLLWVLVGMMASLDGVARLLRGEPM